MHLSKEHVVGRDDACDVVLPGNEISRRHAEFRVDGPVVAVRDLGSRNGVFVNGSARPDARLNLGDVVRCGEWVGILVSVLGGSVAEPVGFGEVAPGWYGGSTLRTAVEPGRRFVTDATLSQGTDPKIPAIVVEGETGSGKEGMARALHRWSGRIGRFVAVNCAALPSNLAEAELFGYRRGAFTGADTASPGLFREADTGTLFLDEILDLPLALQAKLLRVLEERQVRGLGESRDVPVDVRVVAATQVPLSDAVKQGRFRADLHARLEGLTVVLPPLRDRREDIAPLFLEFLQQQARGRKPGIEAKLVEALCCYDWPTNVRELFLMTQQLLGVHGHEGVLKKSHLPERIRASGFDASPPGHPTPLGTPKRAWHKTDDESEFQSLVAGPGLHGGNVAKASASIGKGRARAYRLLSAHPEFSLEDLQR